MWTVTTEKAQAAAWEAISCSDDGVVKLGPVVVAQNLVSLGHCYYCSPDHKGTYDASFAPMDLRRQAYLRCRSENSSGVVLSGLRCATGMNWV